MFTFSCLPQVMEQTTNPYNTIIWICWLADRGFKCWKGVLPSYKVRQGEVGLSGRDRVWLGSG